MKCCCYETEKDFTFCVHDVENTQLEDIIQHMGFSKNDNKFLLSCPQYEISNHNEIELVSKNFSLLGQVFFESLLLGFDYKKPLELIAQKFDEKGIEWYIVGSTSDVVRGVDVKPFDMDIVVHTRDFYKAKDICYFNFPDSVILQFSDNQKLCPLRCFGRLFLEGTLVEIAADEGWNSEKRQPPYEKFTWNGYDVYIDSLQLRYQIEIGRNRIDRIKAIEEYMNRNGVRLHCT
jgi:hypothetical protein